VIKGQAAALFSAVLAGVAVTYEHLSTRESPFMQRPLHHVQEPQDGGLCVFFVRASDHGVRDLKRLGFAVTQ